MDHHLDASIVGDGAEEGGKGLVVVGSYSLAQRYGCKAKMFGRAHVCRLNGGMASTARSARGELDWLCWLSHCEFLGVLSLQRRTGLQLKPRRRAGFQSKGNSDSGAP